MNRDFQGADINVDGPGSRRPWILLFIAVCLVAVNLRMTITGVGPLLDEIAADRGISPAALGALGSVPLLSWALLSPFAHGLGARIGMSNAVSVSLVLLAGGTVWRSLDSSAVNLWLGTALIGAGLAIANVLMPAVIKRDFKTHLGLAMGVYSALLGGLGAVAAGLVVPISQTVVGGTPLGWQAALLASGVFLPAALVLWVWVTRPSGPRGEPPLATGASASISRNAGRRVWGDPVAWLVSLYMGAQSTIFYVLSTWLPSYLLALGASPTLSGLGLMAFQFFGIAGSLLLPLISRGRVERWAPALLPAVGILAWVGFVVAPAAAVVWIIIAGVTGGALLTMSLTLMATRARTHSDSSAISGMAQSVGYGIAAAGPITFGALYGLTGSWTLPFTVVWAAAVLLFIVGVAVGKPRYVFDPSPMATNTQAH